MNRHPLCTCPTRPGPFGIGKVIDYQAGCPARHFLTKADMAAILREAKR